MSIATPEPADAKASVWDPSYPFEFSKATTSGAGKPRGRRRRAFLGLRGSRPHAPIESPVDLASAPRAAPAKPSGQIAHKRATDHKSAADPFSGWRRAFDVAIALIAAITLLPVLILIGVLIKIQGEGTILFVQERVGRGGRPFKCLKFRSMVPNAEARLAAVLASHPELRSEWEQYRKLKRDPRSTRFGELLRSTSLDELPQLYNVIKGDMSLVGPRPILYSEISLYGRWLYCYTSVRPGLTGLWQVSGRNKVPYRRRVAMDRFYSRRFSNKLYISILFATIPAVLFRRGSY